MKRKVTTITEEFDKDGKITNRITETTEEEDTGFIYPQQYYPWYPTTENPINCCTSTTCNVDLLYNNQ